jgi:hypothetical protein
MWRTGTGAAFLAFDLPEEIGHILGERFNDTLCRFWHRGNVAARTPKHPSLSGVHVRRNFSNITLSNSTKIG